MLKNFQFLSLIKDQSSNPIVILDKSEKVLWKNRQMSELIEIDQNWDMILKRYFSVCNSIDIDARVLKSIKRPNLFFEVHSQIINNFRYVELKKVIVKESEQKHSSESDLDNVVDQIVEAFSSDFTSKGVRLNIDSQNCKTIISEEKMFQGLSYFLKSLMAVTENHSLNLKYWRADQDKLFIQLMTEDLNLENFKLLEENFKKKSVMYLQRIEEALKEYSPFIKMRQHTLISNRKYLTIELELNENDTPTTKIRPPEVPICENH